MTDKLFSKAAAIQAVVARLTCALGPERVTVSGDTGDDPESVVIASRTDPSRVVFITITGMAEGRYTATYDKLRTKRTGDASIEQHTSSDVVFEGLCWIARKILDDGVVTEEFERVPKGNRFRE